MNNVVTFRRMGTSVPVRADTAWLIINKIVLVRNNTECVNIIFDKKGKMVSI